VHFVSRRRDPRLQIYSLEPIQMQVTLGRCEPETTGYTDDKARSDAQLKAV
jgi:hypothetical protein